jgi:uncharacterized protein YoxC
MATQKKGQAKSTKLNAAAKKVAAAPTGPNDFNSAMKKVAKKGAKKAPAKKGTTKKAAKKSGGSGGY